MKRIVLLSVLLALFFVCPHQSQAFQFAANNQTETGGLSSPFQISTTLSNVPDGAMVIACTGYAGGNGGRVKITDGLDTFKDGPGANQNTEHSQISYLLRSRKSGTITYTATYEGPTSSRTTLLVQASNVPHGTAAFYQSGKGSGNNTSPITQAFSEAVGPQMITAMCAHNNNTLSPTSIRFGVKPAEYGFQTPSGAHGSLYYHNTSQGFSMQNGTVSATLSSSGDWTIEAATFYEYNSLPWSSSFNANCSDWTNFNNPLNCGTETDPVNRLQKVGGGWCSYDATTIHTAPRAGDGGALGDHYEEIKSVSNYPGGGGGRGIRHWYGTIKSAGGEPNNSGGVAIDFAPYPPVTEIYIREYQRYQAGWIWGGLGMAKTFYLGTYLIDQPNATFLPGPVFNFPDGQSTLGRPDLAQSPAGNNLGLGTGILPQAGGDGAHHGCLACGWKDMYPTGTSDGSWHQLEVHIKLNTYTPGVTTSDGLFEIWVDGRLIYSSGPTISYFNSSQGRVGLSHSKLSGDNGSLWYDYNTPGCHYIDFDDIVVSETGPIGVIRK